MKRLFLYNLMLAAAICSLPAWAANLYAADRHTVTAPTNADDVGIATDHHPNDDNRRKRIDPRRLGTAIERAANYLRQACGTSGQFTYRINLNPQVKVRPRYDVLRHAGSIYSMAMYLNQQPDQQVQAAMIRAGRFLKQKAMGAVPDRPDLLAIWSEPQLSLSSPTRQAKLGGTGLGLVALLSIEKIAPGETSVADLQKLGQFLRYMQKPNGSFYSKYIPTEGGRWYKWKSLYYPGEAALGLLMLYELDPSPLWLKTAADALAYLARSRAHRTEVEADHWALLATAKLLSIDGRHQQTLHREALMKHASQISHSILRQADRQAKSSDIEGCFTGDGRTTPTATRIEGLLAALSFLPPENRKLRHRIIERVTQGMHFLMSAQILEGRYRGAVPRGIQPLPESHPGFNQSFNRRVSEVRIDYVQHTLSAMIQYQYLLQGCVRSDNCVVEQTAG